MTRSARDPLYGRHRFPAEVIVHTVWLYYRFPLSMRMVEDILAACGITVSHQTVRLWAEKFGRHFANNIRKGVVTFCASVIWAKSGYASRLAVIKTRSVRKWVPDCCDAVTRLARQ